MGIISSNKWSHDGIIKITDFLDTDLTNMQQFKQKRQIMQYKLFGLIAEFLYKKQKRSNFAKEIGLARYDKDTLVLLYS